MSKLAHFSESQNDKGKIELNTFIDLFAGIGGFRLALEKYGLKCLFSSEWDKNAQKTYEANFGELPSGDITKIDAKTIPQHDILCAGFPCQSFSISGKQKGFEDTRGTLFFDIARIVEYHKPKVLFLENVKNLVKHNNGGTLKTILRVLDTLDGVGYDVHWKVLNSSFYGAPTSRERVYFVCFRKDLGPVNFDFPEAVNTRIYLKDILERDRDVSEFLIKRRDVMFYKNFIQKPKLGPIQIGKINKGGQGERIYSSYGHAITLSAYGGGAGAKTGAYYVDGEIRKLTPRECARVMGFPESFQIPKRKAQAYKQFGNSVVVLVLERVMAEIMNACNQNDL